MYSDKRKEKCIEALNASAGNISKACKAVGISRPTFYDWKSKDPNFKEQVDDVDEIVLDMAESKLIENIKAGRTAELIFLLKTKGRKRGYIERQEFEIDSTRDFKLVDAEDYLQHLKSLEKD